MTRVCIVTGSRAEYGLLQVLMSRIDEHPDLKLQVAATGSHLSPFHGLTVADIDEDGFRIAARVESLVSSDTGVGTAKSLGLGIVGVADAFAALMPDVVVVLGDRYEILAAAQAAYFVRIPAVHIAGGDVTEGALDESIRQMITKLAAVHFVTHLDAARRVRQLGEDPRCVFNVGHLGLEAIRLLEPPSRKELEESIGRSFRVRNLLVTFHPPTLDDAPPVRQFEELTAALEELGPGSESCSGIRMPILVVASSMRVFVPSRCAWRTRSSSLPWGGTGT